MSRVIPPARQHHRRPPALLITFRRDGSADFHPIVDSDTEQLLLAERLSRLVAFLIENPSQIARAAGLLGPTLKER